MDELKKKKIFQMMDPPSAFWDASNDTYYTYLLQDTGFYMTHYLVVNIPGNRLDEGEVVFDYLPSFSLNFDSNDNFVRFASRGLTV